MVVLGANLYVPPNLALEFGLTPQFDIVPHFAGDPLEPLGFPRLHFENQNMVYTVLYVYGTW